LQLPLGFDKIYLNIRIEDLVIITCLNKFSGIPTLTGTQNGVFFQFRQNLNKIDALIGILGACGIPMRPKKSLLLLSQIL